MTSSVVRHGINAASEISDGVTVRVLDASPAAPAESAAALRALARLLVRRHRQKGDCEPNATPETRSSSLTVVPHPSADNNDETG